MNTVGCLGKIGYETRADGDKAKAHIHQKRDYVNGDPLACYHCAKCGKFHLGRSRRTGHRELRRTPDHEHDSFQSRLSRYRELTK